MLLDSLKPQKSHAMVPESFWWKSWLDASVYIEMHVAFGWIEKLKTFYVITWSIFHLLTFIIRISNGFERMYQLSYYKRDRAPFDCYWQDSCVTIAAFNSLIGELSFFSTLIEKHVKFNEKNTKMHFIQSRFFELHNSELVAKVKINRNNWEFMTAP